MSPAPIRSLFAQEVTRDIPPVVYFHEQSPQKLADEVSEYIITGGWPAGHPNKVRVPEGIHEQVLRLVRSIHRELQRPGGPSLPTAWISGFYGSGKSSFAKLFGLALDGIVLPDGRPLAEAWLERDQSPLAHELREAWNALLQTIQPMAVVFDVGGVARDNEHIHTAIVRKVQERLGYCATQPHVADFELRLERDGEYERFLTVFEEVLGEPWTEARSRSLAEEDFSLAMNEMFPKHYPEPTSWFESRAGTALLATSPEDAVRAIRDMLQFRAPEATLFVVVDEVSQYVLGSSDRVDRLRVFASALGAGLKGKAWLLALGQQKIEEGADQSFLTWAKDRFPPHLRVHLASTNIRDVVHRRLLHKSPAAEVELRALYRAHQDRLRLYAYGCTELTEDEFVEAYPLLPSYIELIMQLTTQLRTRSTRAQGDDQAIRGLLQLLGEMFRSHGLADAPIGGLVSLDQIYDVQHTALDSDTQNGMARIRAQCTGDDAALQVSVAKAVALLELIQDTEPTTAELVARCLYDRVDRGNRLDAVKAALQELKDRRLLGYSEKLGYKLQSSAGEEWERERSDIGISRDTIHEFVREALVFQMGIPERPRLKGRAFPWVATFSDGRGIENASLVDSRDDAVVHVDFRYLLTDDRTRSTWVKRSDETALRNRIVWVCGDVLDLETTCRELGKSQRMVQRHQARQATLTGPRRLLLTQEQTRAEDLRERLRKALEQAFLKGSLYFRGRPIDPFEHGTAMATVLKALGDRHLPELFPSFLPTQVKPGELLQLVAQQELVGISPKFLQGELGIFDLEGGHYVPTCGGLVPRQVQELIEQEQGISGAALIARFGGPPYGYVPNVVKACVAGLLRAGRVKLQPESGDDITAVRDAGVQELFERDRAFRRAALFPAGDDDIGIQARNRIRKLFKQHFKVRVANDNQAIADAVEQHFRPAASKVREVLTRLHRMPGPPPTPDALARLTGVFEQCLRRVRQTLPTVQAVKRNLDVLRDGMQQLALYYAELTPTATQAVQVAGRIRDNHARQLAEAKAHSPDSERAAAAVSEQLAVPRPWQGIATIDDELETLRQRYAQVRQDALAWQQDQADLVRTQIKARVGFSTLTPDQSHHVLRPIQEACTDTTAEAVAPALSALRDPFEVRLKRARDEANRRLDELLSKGPAPVIQRVDLQLQDREVTSRAEVEALVSEVRERLLQQVEKGVRVRIV